MVSSVFDASEKLDQSLKAYKRRFPSGATLKDEGDDCAATYCVEAGWLTVSKSMPDGERQIIDVILPGEIMDPRSANGHTSRVMVETLTDATVAIVPRAVWSHLAGSDPDIRQVEATILAAAMSRISERMLRLGKGTAESRIAYILIELCMRLTTAYGGKDCSYHLPMTQQVLGDLVGLSSVHVCRTMRRLSRGGLISTADHIDVTIHDVDALARIAGIDVDGLRSEIIAIR
jgi:CRP-like cAMP-binding protein